MTSPSTAGSPARRHPPGRYDGPSLLGQRVLAVLMTALLLALLVAGGSFLWSRTTGEQIRGTVRTFDVRSDDEVEMQLEVTKTAGAAAYCVVRARDRTGVEVGRDVAVVDAEGTADELVRRTVVLATTARSVTAEVAGCTPERISRDDPAP